MHCGERPCATLGEIENLDPRQRAAGPDFVVADFPSYRLDGAVLQNLLRMLAVIVRETFRPRWRPAETPWNLRNQYPSRFRMRELSHEAGLKQKSILKRIDERAKHARTRHSGRFEFCDPMRSIGGTILRIERRVERGAVGNAIGVGRESRVAPQLRFVERATSRSPCSVGRRFHRDKSIHGRKRTRRHDLRTGAPHWNRFDAGKEVFGQSLYLHVHNRFELRAIDALASADGLARIEPREHPFAGDQRGKKVREDEAEFFALTAGRARYAGQTRNCLRDRIHAGLAAIRTSAAESRGRGVNDSRVDRDDRVVTNAKPVGYSRPPVLQGDIAMACNIQSLGDIVGIFQIENYRLLAATIRRRKFIAANAPGLNIPNSEADSGSPVAKRLRLVA